MRYKYPLIPSDPCTKIMKLDKIPNKCKLPKCRNSCMEDYNRCYKHRYMCEVLECVHMVNPRTYKQYELKVCHDHYVGSIKEKKILYPSHYHHIMNGTGVLACILAVKSNLFVFFKISVTYVTFFITHILTEIRKN